MGDMATNGKPDFGILLLLADQEFVRDLRAATAEQGFDDQGRSDGFVLRTLGAAPTTISGLAERLEISKQGAGQIIDDMERRGYVERQPGPDRRPRPPPPPVHRRARQPSPRHASSTSPTNAASARNTATRRSTQYGPSSPRWPASHRPPTRTSAR